jgi:hypothetical protein
MRSAGFVKIKARPIKIYIGKWGAGNSLKTVRLIVEVDPNATESSRIAMDVWIGAYVALTRKLKDDYKDDAAIEKFKERITADFLNPDYHLYSIAYDLLGIC